MTDREKLIALMREVDACICNLCGGGEGRFNHSAGILADHLLANGVVVREKGEWEPVLNERGEQREEEIFARVWRCQACGEEEFYGNFCHECGADMRTGENDG